MKITTFNPQIITKDLDSIVKLFEELGFEMSHHPTGIGDLDVEGIRMKDENGFHLDISQSEYVPIPHDVIAIRMNVDDFDEAFSYLRDHGFKNIYKNKAAETDSSKSAVMISPSGYAINLVYHKK